MTTISARTILRSRNLARPDKIVSTILCRYPRWIHAEGRTHRLLDIGEDFAIWVPTPSLMECDDLSRNAASSRAIPASRMIEDVLSDPAVPIWWGKNQKGMQAPEELYGAAREAAIAIWMESMHDAIRRAQQLAAVGAHKQIVNRVMEPYSHITVLVTATEWSNFLAVRDHPDAEPHIAMLAREIRKCLEDESTVQNLEPGQWHTPFVTEADHQKIYDDYVKSWTEQTGEHEDAMPLCRHDDGWLAKTIPLSVARNASTSYTTVDGFDMTMDRAIALHDKLVASDPMHASPAEHVCQADSIGFPIHPWQWHHPEQHGNLIGWRQYRKTLKGECK